MNEDVKQNKYYFVFSITQKRDKRKLFFFLIPFFYDFAASFFHVNEEIVQAIAELQVAYSLTRDGTKCQEDNSLCKHASLFHYFPITMT